MKYATHRQSRARYSEAGFTLVEAFVALFIIAALAIVSVPAITNTLTHQKLASATNVLVNQVEFARVQAASRNLAYRLRVELSDGANSGAIFLDEGIGPACTPANFEDAEDGPDPIFGVRQVDLTDDYPRVRLESAQPNALMSDGSAQLCFKPDGRVLTVNGAAVTPPEGYAAGEAIFLVRLYSERHGENAQATEMAREVVVPYNGIPKVRNVAP